MFSMNNRLLLSSLCACVISKDKNFKVERMFVGTASPWRGNKSIQGSETQPVLFMRVKEAEEQLAQCKHSTLL